MEGFRGYDCLLRRTLPQASGKWFMIAVWVREGRCCGLQFGRVVIRVKGDSVADEVCVDGLRWDVGM